MNFEFFFKYCFKKYLSEYGSRAYFEVLDISINNIYVFKTKNTDASQLNAEPVEVNLIKDYHFGLVSSHMERFMGEVRTGDAGLSYTTYAELLNNNRDIMEFRPSTIMEKLKNGTLGDRKYHIDFSVELSDTLYLLLNREMNEVAIKLQSTEFADIYDHFKNNKETVFSCIMERYMNLEGYIEKLAANAADLLIFLTNEKIANYLSYCEFVLKKTSNVKSIYNDHTYLINSGEAIQRFKVAYKVLMTFLSIYPTTSTNRGLLTINSGLNINKLKAVLSNMLIMKNLESNVLYIFNSQYTYLYDDANDLATVLLRYLHSILLSKPNTYQALDMLNGIDAKKFDLNTHGIFNNTTPENVSVTYVEAIRTADISHDEVFLITMDLAIHEAMDAYNKTQDEAEEGNTDARTGHLERSKNNLSNTAYNIKYKMKTYNIDRKKKKYERLLNEISKDMYIVQSKSSELTSASEKNNLIREIHSMKGELIGIKAQAKSMNDEDLLDIIEERIAFAEEILDTINKRNIRQERKGISFKLERDMTSDLRKLNGTSDVYDKDVYNGDDE